MITENLLDQIDRGREGKNWGLSMGMPKLEKYIDGVSQGTYTLLFSGSGIGKSSFALSSYVYRPIMDNIDDLDKFQIIYISLEMKAEVLLAKLLSTYIFETYGKEISYKQMLSKTRNEVLSDEDYDLIQKSTPWMKRVESFLIIYNKQLTAGKYNELLLKIAEANGYFEDLGNRKIYHPKNPNKVILFIIDHLALVTKTGGNSLKNEMDNVSSLSVYYRNTCNFSFLKIMQSNRESANIERRKMDLMEPQRSDIKDSSCMEADCDNMIALYNPFREKLNSYRGYDIKTLDSHFRSVILLKNRYGDGDISIGCSYFGNCNLWHELPRADEINDYEKYTNTDIYNPKMKIKEEEEIRDVKINMTL